MGPLESLLRAATQGCGAWLPYKNGAIPADLVRTIARIGTSADLRQIVYGADMFLRGIEKPRGLADIVNSGDLPDVLTEAICFAEALDQEVETRSRPCPNCGEPNDPEEDCEFFGCNKCGKEICESCASSGMCEACDGKHNGTVTVRFK